MPGASGRVVSGSDPTEEKETQKKRRSAA